MKVMKRIVGAVLVLAMTVSLAISAFAADAQFVEGATDEKLVVGLSAEPMSTDGVAGMGQQAGCIEFSLYDNLIQWDSVEGVFKPMLAESYEWLDDNTLEMKLRQDVTFHDGEPFNAEAVLWNFQNIKEHSNSAGLYISNFDVDSFKVVDEYTIDIVTSKPYILAETFLSLMYTGMMSPKAVEAVGYEEYTRNPNGGSGPYKFVEWVPGDHITLERNEEYYGTLPYYKTLVFKFIIDDNARGLALQEGSVDVIENILENQAKEFQAGTAIDVFVPEKITAYALWFNCREDRPTHDLAMRQAIAYAIDTSMLPAILDMEVSADPADGMAFKGSDSYREPKEPYYPADLDKAKELMAQAGYAEGELNMVILHQEGLLYSTMAEYIQFCLSQIGINATIESVSAGVSRERQAEGSYDMYIQRHSTYDPNSSAMQWYESNSPMNNLGFSSDAFDAAAAACTGVIDPAQFNTNLMDLLDIVREEVPAYYLMHTTSLFGIKNTLGGIYTEKMLGGIFNYIRPYAQ